MFWSIVGLAFAQVASEPAEPGLVTDVVDVSALVEEEPRPFVIGVGSFFNAGGSFQAQPRDLTVAGFDRDLPYSGMAGFGAGVGFRLDARYQDVIGFEFQLVRSWDKATTRYTINDSKIDFTMRQPAWHVPMHLQIGIPSTTMRPYIFGGVVVVVPDEAQVPQPPELIWDVSGSATTWFMYSFGFGFEARLPIEEVDLRIPIQFRGAVTSPYADSAVERADYRFGEDFVTSMDYDLRWQYHASINIGMSWFFL